MSNSANGEHATTDNLSERAHESMDRVTRSAGRGAERVRHEAADLEARVRKAGKRAGKKARKHSEESLQTASDFVRDNPMLVLGLAFAAGALLTALRRRS